jgi:hypothetical protein
MRALFALPLVLFAAHVDHVWHVGHDVVTARSSSANQHAFVVRHGGALQTLVADSPFPFQATSVRAADLTGDGRPDLLVTVECNVCNHATATAAVFARSGSRYRRIYGWGFLAGSKDGRRGVHGRVIAETAWGAWHGQMWFDEPRGGRSVCCPAYRLRTFFRWTGRKFAIVRKQRVSADGDHFLGQRPVPAP